MARILLTEQEVQRIIVANKRINGDVEWQYRPNEGYAKCQLPVVNTLAVNLKMVANVNMEEQIIYSFSLILSNAYRIRGLDVSGSHKNKHTNNSEWRGTTHKHRWSDSCRESFAYTPEENILPQNIENAFRTFCKECNIDFEGRVKTLPPKQLSMKLE